MSDQQSIVGIFDLLNNSSPISPAARKTVDNIHKTYPYFIPARYMKALDNYRNDRSWAAVNSITTGYVGNWMMFHDYMLGTPFAPKNLVADEGSAETYPPKAEQHEPQPEPEQEATSRKRPIMADGPVIPERPAPPLPGFTSFEPEGKTPPAAPAEPDAPKVQEKPSEPVVPGATTNSFRMPVFDM
jgi:hypothetical protein